MSDDHPHWSALLEWLSEKGMDTSNILVAAKETPGKDQNKGHVGCKLMTSRFRRWLWSFCIETDTSFHTTVQDPG